MITRIVLPIKRPFFVEKNFLFFLKKLPQNILSCGSFLLKLFVELLNISLIQHKVIII